jgi:hypothetical protein
MAIVASMVASSALAAPCPSIPGGYATSTSSPSNIYLGCTIVAPPLNTSVSAPPPPVTVKTAPVISSITSQPIVVTQGSVCIDDHKSIPFFVVPPNQKDLAGYAAALCQQKGLGNCSYSASFVMTNHNAPICPPDAPACLHATVECGESMPGQSEITTVPAFLSPTK